MSSNTTTSATIYKLYAGDLHTLEKEYIHCSEIIQFFWFLFIFLMLVAAIIRACVLKTDVNSKDSLYTKCSVEEEQKPANPAPSGTTQNQKEKTQSPRKENQKMEMKENIPEKEEEAPNVIKIDDEEDQQPKEDENKGAQPQDDKIINEDDIQLDEKAPQPQKETNTDAQKRRDEEEKGKSPQKKVEVIHADEQTVDKKEAFCAHVEKTLDFHFPFIAIAILLIASWGSYIYSVFALFVIFIKILLINRMQIFKASNEERQKNWQLGFHFWVVTLFLNYLINDQQKD